MKRLTITLLILVLVMVAACSKDDEKSPTDAPETPAAELVPTDTSVPPTATPVPPTATSEPTAEPTEEPATTPDEEGTSLTDAQLATLDALDSYRASTLIALEGVNAEGADSSETLEFEVEVVRDPPAQHVIMQGIGGFADGEEAGAMADTLEMYMIDDTVYFLAEGQWIQLPGGDFPFDDPALAVAFNSGVLFSDLEGAERIRPDEEINGIDSRHYAFDETVVRDSLQIGEGDEVTVDGDVWIAIDGGFVTRYVLDMEVLESSGGLIAPDMTSGTVHMEFELSDVNEDFVVELPEAVTAGAAMPGFEDEAFPLPQDGLVTMSSADLSMAQSALSPEEVQAFYDDALADLGWVKNEDNSGAFGNMVNLEFTKGPFTLSLLISSEGAGGPTQIMASVESSQ